MNEQQGQQAPQQDAHRTKRAVLLAVIILVLAAVVFLLQRPKTTTPEQLGSEEGAADVGQMAQEIEPTGNIDDVIKALENDAEAESGMVGGFDDSDALLQDSDIINSYGEELDI